MPAGQCFDIAPLGARGDCVGGSTHNTPPSVPVHPKTPAPLTELNFGCYLGQTDDGEMTLSMRHLCHATRLPSVETCKENIESPIKTS